MLSIFISPFFLLACCAAAASTPSLPQSNCAAGEQLRLQPQPKLLGKCVAPGLVEGSANLRESLCAVDLGLDRGRCKTTCSGLSPSIRQDLSVYSTGMAMDHPNLDGDPQAPAVLTMVPVSHDSRLHDGAASAMEASRSGKYSDNLIPQLSGHHHRRPRHRRGTPPAGQQQQQQQQTNELSTVRKVLGGIAVAVLVMVV